MGIIIDRRLNQGNKNLGNRQRFIGRARDHIKRSIRENLQNRSISDTKSGERIKIPIDTIREPNFGHDWNTGESRRVLPGNRDYVPDDQIERPKGGGGGRGGGQASDDHEITEDDFQFSLSKDEFYDLFFEDLELPDMIRKQLKKSTTWEIRREGISTVGNPSNLNVIRTMKASLGRRLVLRKPNEREIEELEEEAASLDPNSDRYQEIQLTLVQLRRRVSAVSYVDPIDLRYNVFNRKQTPSTTAVMFCLMDVSGSMDENKKDLAKRFFMLLYLFLQKKYERVTVEFVRHHTQAERVTEQSFFYDRVSGGTMVSSALELAINTIQEEYDPALYNIYVCQASDGDNFDSDNPRCRDLLENQLLPLIQYMAYVEIANHNDLSEYPLLHFTDTRLYNTYNTVAQNNPKLQVNKVADTGDIYPVFRKLFEKR